MNPKTWHQKFFQYGILLCMLYLLNACATVPRDPNQPTEEDKAKYQNMTTLDAISKVEGILVHSRQRELDIFAPEHYELADSALMEAKNLISQNQPKEKIIQKFAIAEAVLKNGDKVMSNVKTILKEEISAKKKLEQINAPEIYSTEFGNLVERLNKVIRNIENGKMEQANKSRQALAKSLNELQVKTIIHNAMNEPSELLRRVEYRGGDTLAPITFSDAKKVIKKSEEFIKNNVFNAEAVEEVSKQALFAAKRALYITEEVASLSHRITISVEQVVLDQEYRMTRIARALRQNDFRDNSIEVQSELLADSVKDLNTQIHKQDDLIIALRDTLIKVRDAQNPLTELSQKYDSLQQEKNSWLAKDALYKAKVDQLTVNLNEKEKSLSRLITHVETLENTQSSGLTALKNTLTEKEKTIANKERDIAQLQTLVSILSEDNAHQVSLLNSDNEPQSNEKDAELIRLTKEVTEQKTTLQKSGRSLVALREKHKKQLARKEQNIKKLNQQLARHQKQEKTIANLQEKIRIFRKGQDNSINAKVVASQKIIAQKDEDIAQLKNKIIQFQEEQSLWAAEKNKLFNQIQKKQHTIKQQQQNIASIQQQTTQKPPSF